MTCWTARGGKSRGCAIEFLVEIQYSFGFDWNLVLNHGTGIGYATNNISRDGTRQDGHP